MDLSLDAGTIAALLSAAAAIGAAAAAFGRGSNRGRARLQVDAEILSKLPSGSDERDAFQKHVDRAVGRLIDNSLGLHDRTWYLLRIVICFGLLGIGAATVLAVDSPRPVWAWPVLAALTILLLTVSFSLFKAGWRRSSTDSAVVSARKAELRQRGIDKS